MRLEFINPFYQVRRLQERISELEEKNKILVEQLEETKIVLDNTNNEQATV